MTRQVEQDASVSDSSPHIANIGKMVEDMENKIRYVMYKILMYIVGIGMVCHCAQTFDKKKLFCWQVASFSNGLNGFFFFTQQPRIFCVGTILFFTFEHFV